MDGERPEFGMLDTRRMLSTGDPAVDQLIREGKLTPASNPGGLAALLAIKPAPASHDSDTAEVVSDLRADHG